MWRLLLPWLPFYCTPTMKLFFFPPVSQILLKWVCTAADASRDNGLCQGQAVGSELRCEVTLAANAVYLETVTSSCSSTRHSGIKHMRLVKMVQSHVRWMQWMCRELRWPHLRPLSKPLVFNQHWTLWWLIVVQWEDWGPTRTCHSSRGSSLCDAVRALNRLSLRHVTINAAMH